MPKKPKVPLSIVCGGCGRKLNVDNYATEVPADAPADRVHNRRVPGKAFRTVICANCGHYTMESV